MPKLLICGIEKPSKLSRPVRGDWRASLGLSSAEDELEPSDEEEGEDDEDEEDDDELETSDGDGDGADESILLSSGTLQSDINTVGLARFVCACDASNFSLVEAMVWRNGASGSGVEYAFMM